MALVVLLRGVNVGGHKAFQPSALAKELADFDVVNVGAAGTFVVLGLLASQRHHSRCKLGWPGWRRSVRERLLSIV